MRAQHLIIRNALAKLLRQTHTRVRAACLRRKLKSVEFDCMVTQEEILQHPKRLARYQQHAQDLRNQLQQLEQVL